MSSLSTTTTTVSLETLLVSVSTINLNLVCLSNLLVAWAQFTVGSIDYGYV
jgi:hypothetical protein